MRDCLDFQKGKNAESYHILREFLARLERDYRFKHGRKILREIVERGPIVQDEPVPDDRRESCLALGAKEAARDYTQRDRARIPNLVSRHPLLECRRLRRYSRLVPFAG